MSVKFTQLLEDYLDARDEWLRVRGASGRHGRAQEQAARERMQVFASIVDKSVEDIAMAQARAHHP